MFWENFIKLCTENNTKPNPVAAKLGISSGSVTNWKNGTMPNSATLMKIANYFNVSPDYLLGRTDEPVSPTDDDLLNLLRENKGQGTIIGFGDGRHIKTDMTYEDFEEIEAMWRALKEKRNK